MYVQFSNIWLYVMHGTCCRDRPMVKYLAGSQPSFPREGLFGIVPPQSPFVQVLHTGNCYRVTTSNVNVHGGTHAYVIV